MTVFVSLGDPGAELAALLGQTPAKGQSGSDTVLQLLTSDCIDAILGGDAAKAKTAFTIAFSTIASMNVQDIAKLSDLVTARASSSTVEASDLRLWTITSLFNAVQVESIKARVLAALLQYGLDAHLAHTLRPSLPCVERWLDDWGLADVAKARLLALVADLFEASEDSEQALTHRLKLLMIRSDDKAVCELQASASSKSIAFVLKSGKLAMLDRLLKMITARKLPASPLLDLLTLMCRGSSSDLETFCQKQAAVLTQFDITADQLRSYLNSLTVCSLAQGRTTLSLKDDIQDTLALSTLEDAEQVFIDAVSLGLVDGQIDENEGRVYITSSMYRSVDNEVWKYLQQRLQTWRDSVAAVLPWSHHVPN